MKATASRSRSQHRQSEYTRNGFIHIIFCSIVLFTSFCMLIAFSIITSIQVNAIPDSSTLDSFYRNGIYYYDPSSTQCDPSYGADDIGGGSVSGGSSGTGLDSQQEQFVADHVNIAQKLSVEYGIPWETVVAQGILESAAGTTRLARDKHNYFGIGAYDDCPYECALSYGSELEGWQGYYENIRKTSTYRNHGVFRGNTITDPIAYLVAIKAAGYATDPNYIEKVSRIIRYIQDLAAQNGWLSSADLAQQYPEMLANAEANAAGASAPSIDLTNEVNVCMYPSIDGISDYDGSGFPYYNQFDPKWAGIDWGGGNGSCGSGPHVNTIGKSGCGPSSFAMMATALTGKAITPDMTAKIAGEEGCHVSSGSSWKITQVLAAQYGLQYKDLAASSRDDAIQKINQALDDGWMIHTSGKGSNPFTSGGHYIGIRGLTSDGKWLIADSNGTNGRENTLNRAFDPGAVINAGMNISNIKAIKKY